MSKSIEASRVGSKASAVLRLTEVLSFLSLLHESEVGIFTGGQALEDSVALEAFRVRPQYKTDVSMVSATIALVSARVGRYENHCNPTNVCICPGAYISQCEFSLTIQLASEKELRYLCSSCAFSLNFGRPACPLITAVLLASFFSELTPHASAHESPKSVLVEGPTGDMSKGWRHPGKFCKRISFPDAVRLNWPQTDLRVSLTQNRPPPR